MAGNVHGSKTYVSIAGTDLSTFIDNVNYNRTADSHDCTGMGADAHEYLAGLTGGQMQLSGSYHSTSAGPRATLEPLIGSTVAVVYRPEGTGSSLPEDQFFGLVVGYDETSPVADRKQWAATLLISGSVVATSQGA